MKRFKGGEDLRDDELLKMYEFDPNNAVKVTAERYYGYIYAVAAARLSGFPREDIEEVADDVLMRFRRDFGLVDLGRGSVKSYLALLAQSMAINRRRELSRRTDLPLEEAANSVSEDDSPEAQLCRRELLRRVSELPDEQRKIIVMRYFYGMPHKEIARRLGLKETAVRKKTERALKKLGADKEGLL